MPKPADIKFTVNYIAKNKKVNVHPFNILIIMTRLYNSLQGVQGELDKSIYSTNFSLFFKGRYPKPNTDNVM